VTFTPSLIASARANCKSPNSPLTSLATRFAFVTYRKEGTAIVNRIAATDMVMINSSRLNPWARDASIAREGIDVCRTVLTVRFSMDGNVGH
jgi:hypothetical protein